MTNVTERDISNAIAFARRQEGSANSARDGGIRKLKGDHHVRTNTCCPCPMGQGAAFAGQSVLPGRDRGSNSSV